MTVTANGTLARPAGCRAEDPATCRTHGDEIRAKQAFFREVLTGQPTPATAPEPAPVELSPEEKHHQRVLEDIRASMNPKRARNGQRTVTVYRVGVPTPPVERRVEKESYEAVDQHRPAGRQGRMDGVFASPTLGSAARWVKGISGAYRNLDVSVRRLTINPDTTYIYPVSAWEKISSQYDYGREDLFPERAQAYWATGITVTEWMKRVRDGEHLDPADWEMMLPPTVADDHLNQGNVKMMPPKKVADQAYQDYLDPEHIELVLRSQNPNYRVPRNKQHLL